MWLTTSETLFPTEIPFTQAGCFWTDSWASAVCLTIQCTSQATTATACLWSPCLCYCYRLQYIPTSNLRGITVSRGRPHSSRRHATPCILREMTSLSVIPPPRMLPTQFNLCCTSCHPSQGVCIHHTARVRKEAGRTWPGLSNRNESL